MLKLMLALVLAYIAAAPLTSKISMDLSQTEWTNVWTYLIWSTSFFIWALILIFGTLFIMFLRNLFR